MYKCGGREARVPPGGVKESNKRETRRITRPSRSTPQLPGVPPRSSPRSFSDRGFLSDKIPTIPAITARDYPLSFLALFVARSRGREGKVAGGPAVRRENGDNSRWLRRLRSFRALTRLIANLWKRALRSAAEGADTLNARVALASGAPALALAFAAATQRV